MMQSNALVLVLFGGMLSLGCGGSERPAADASTASSPASTSPDTTTGPGAGEPSDTRPSTANTAATPDSNDSRSTGSTGPDTSSSNEGPSASPVH